MLAPGKRRAKATLGRVRDVRSGPDGFRYLRTDSLAGVLARLEPAGSSGK